MNGRVHSHGPWSRITWSPANPAVTALLTIVILTLTAQAQTYSVIHNFTGGTDGANPYAGVTVTPSGVLYGTARGGGNGSAGTVFQLSQVHSGWIFSPLYEFIGNNDGLYPEGEVVIGPNGALYGTTSEGGAGFGGTVFELRPPPTFCRSILLCYWGETVLYSFTGAPDGEDPDKNLTFDISGNIYGTTFEGGTNNEGAVFELTPSGGGYKEAIIHSFSSGTDGKGPEGVVFDTAGNVYGTTALGGTGGCDDGCGTVYQLMPSDGGWVANVLVNFDGAMGETP